MRTIRTYTSVRKIALLVNALFKQFSVLIIGQTIILDGQHFRRSIPRDVQPWPEISLDLAHGETKPRSHLKPAKADQGWVRVCGWIYLNSPSREKLSPEVRCSFKKKKKRNSSLFCRVKETKWVHKMRGLKLGNYLNLLSKNLTDCVLLIYRQKPNSSLQFSNNSPLINYLSDKHILWCIVQ